MVLRALKFLIKGERTEVGGIAIEDRRARVKIGRGEVKKNVLIITGFIMFFICIVGITNVSAKVIYVNAASTAVSPDGSSWAKAYKYLQDGLNAASSGDQIWVAEGTYRPDQGAGRIVNSSTETFNLKNGVALYGGFAGDETIRAQRNQQSRETILSGDIGTINNLTDNSYHVVTANGVSSTAILDGFKITKGYADGSSPHNAGGGMYVSYPGGPTVTNCVFEDNYAYYGGGIYTNGTSSLLLTNCSFINNGSNEGLYVLGSSNTRVINSVFYESSVRIVNGNTTFVNCTFFDESWVIRIENAWDSARVDIELFNCIVWGNTSTTRIIAIVDPAVQLTSAIYINIAYSVIKGGESTINKSAKVYIEPPYATNHNKETDPLLIAPGNTPPNLRLAPNSPAIDAGDNSLVPADTSDLDGDGNITEKIPTDPDGHLRFMDDPSVIDTGAGSPPIVDIGAYEHNRIIHVDGDAHGINDGTSWGNAFNYLQDALAKAVSTAWNDEIWVAEGTYYPDQGGTPPANLREATFQLRNGVSLYGGFSGTETRRVERNWRAYKTILNGDRGVAGNFSDNSYHVVTASGTNATAMLNGFIITNGVANGSFPHNEGGGLYNNGGSPIVANCIFLKNSAGDGGGVYNSANGPQYINCAFLGNVAINGGGMYNYRSGKVEVINSIFSGNEAQYGGGLEDWESSLTTLINCTFSHNTANNYGGGISTLYGSDYTTLRNTILWGNTAPNGPQIAVASSYLSYQFCDLQGGDSGVLVEGSSKIDKAYNLAADPYFVDADGTDNTYGTDDDNLRLGKTDCVDAGDDRFLPADTADLDDDGNITEDIPVDLDGRRRITGKLDMGAYEYSNLKIYVNQAATGRNDGTSWANAYSNLQNALFKSLPGDEIWVAKGTYTPDRGGGNNPGDRKEYFKLISGVGLYGGFGGTETSRSQRNWKNNVTILSGDLGRNDGNFTNNEDNSHHVVVGSGTDATAIIDGFTISGGHANHPDFVYPETGGAGMYNQGGSPTISNCIFEKNLAEIRGGGGILNHGSSSPNITRCAFRNNSAGTLGSGGGIYNAYDSNPTLTNCMFTNNSGDYGGAVHNVFTSVVNMTNCTFGYNHAYTRGGAIRSYWDSDLTIKNTIFYGNTSSQGPQIALDDGSILSISYSDLQGGQTHIYPPGSTVYWGAGNMDEDPLFADDALHLDLLSPCIDAGDPASPYSNEPLPNGGRINMGAYGNTDEATTTVARIGDLNGDGDVDISDVILDLRMALGLDPAGSCSDINGDGQVDISDVILTLRMALGLDPLRPCT